MKGVELSFGMWAVIASIVVHGTVAAAFAAHGQPAAPAPAPPPTLIDIQREVAPVLVPAPPPPPEPAAPVAPATLDSHLHHAAAAPASHAAPAAPEVVAPQPIPAVAEAPATALPTFTIALSSGSGGTGVARTAGAGTGLAGAAQGTAPREAEVLDVGGPSALADRIYGASPVYPTEAQEARVEGDVPLLMLIDTQGHVTDVRVQRRAGYGLDDAAVRAVRTWTFKPRSLHGRPIAVRLRWTMQFRLQ